MSSFTKQSRDNDLALNEYCYLTMFRDSGFTPVPKSIDLNPAGVSITMEAFAGDISKLPPSIGLFTRMAACIAYLHARGVAHRDVKQGNFLFDYSGRVVVSDLETMRRIDSSYSEDRVICTATTRAPEAAKLQHGTGVDVWALGATMFEKITGEYFVGMDNNDDRWRHITDINARLTNEIQVDNASFGEAEYDRMYDKLCDEFDTPESVLAALEPAFDSAPYVVSAELKTLIAKCLIPNPKLRITAYVLYLSLSALTIHNIEPRALRALAR